MPTTFGVFFLGNSADIDPTEGNTNAENAANIVGSTFGSSTDPLAANVQTLSPGTTGFAGGASTNNYDGDNSTANDTFSIDGGADQVFDSSATYTATVTYVDGSTGTLTAVVVQDTTGNLYLYPAESQNSNQAVLEGGAIESLSLDSLNNSDRGGENATRIDGSYVTPDGTVDGTSGDDTIGDGYIDSQGDNVGGADGDDDVIDAGAGADTIIVEDSFGNDTILGGETGTDDDSIDLTALTGPTTVSYSDDETGTITDGVDTINFSEIENIFLTDQNDSVDGSATTDGLNIFAGDGDDTITGGWGSDTIEGGSDDDSITGSGTASTGPELITNGTFDSNMSGWTVHNPTGGHAVNSNAGKASFNSGNETSFGDSIEQDFASQIGATHDVSLDLHEFGSGSGEHTFQIDILDDTGAVVATQTHTVGNGQTLPVSFDFIATSSTSTIQITNTTSTNSISTDGRIDNVSIVEVLEDEGDLLSGEGGYDTIVGGAGDDTIDGGDQNDTIYGGDGNDLIDGGEELSYGDDDLIYGGSGNDTITSTETDSRSNDEIYGEDGDDLISVSGGDANTLDGGAGDDTIISSTGSDTISGGSGEDSITGGSGSDTMDGGDDADTFIIENLFGNDSITGGEGTSGAGESDYDVIDLSAVTSGPVTLNYTGEEEGTITDGSDTISFFEIEQITLTDQNDQIDGSSQWPGQSGDKPGMNVNTGGGNDTVTGGRGGDTVNAGSGDDSIEGDYGDDSLAGGTGGDTISGGDGNDTLEGGAGNDNLQGGLQADTLSGGDGADTLDAGTGDDQITGGDGNDVFIHNSGDGNDTITDFNTGNSGTLTDGDNTNNDFIDLTAYYDSLSEIHADQADDGVLNQSNSTDLDGQLVDYSDNTDMNGDLTFTGASADKTFFTKENTGVVCFSQGAQISTEEGSVLVECLKPGDLVVTRDNGPQPLLWIAKRELDQKTLCENENLKPVLVKPELVRAFAPLLVSPQHGLLLAVDGEETMIRAAHLARMEGGQARVVKGCRAVTYYHLMFEHHQVVRANGAWSESFYPGPVAVQALETSNRQEMSSLFPDLTKECVTRSYGPQCREFARWGNLPSALRELEAC